MENATATSVWWFRLICIILGMIEVDVFKTFCHFSRHKQVPSHRDFIERLVIILLRKRKEKVELQSLPHSSCSSGSTRGMTMVMMRTSDVECEDEHQIMSISQYLDARDSLADKPAKEELANVVPASLHLGRHMTCTHTHLEASRMI